MLFSLFLSLSLGEPFKHMEMNFLKIKEMFYWERVDAKKPLSYFTYVSPYKRIKEVFEVVFPRNSPNYR
jgi:hypothetical protein